jgi:hypothetical protein
VIYLTAEKEEVKHVLIMYLPIVNSNGVKDKLHCPFYIASIKKRTKEMETEEEMVMERILNLKDLKIKYL